MGFEWSETRSWGHHQAVLDTSLQESGQSTAVQMPRDIQEQKRAALGRIDAQLESRGSADSLVDLPSVLDPTVTSAREDTTGCDLRGCGG
jgi:enamine deaminase RidA (YjgF/YER057c/UK114 family)